MEETRRWTVTYTKHIKQKRKVYQDGALEICRSSGVDKAMLYDESGRLLESRYLKKDEVVECGGALAFDSHLVDIGDPEGDCKPLTDLNVQGRDVKPIERIGIFGTKKAGLGSSSLVTRKRETVRSGASGNCQNLIHSNKRGNKEAGREKTGVPHNCHTATEISAKGNEESALEDVGGHKEHQNITQDTTREWHALYTTQKTQKSKKYHDGILRLKVSLSQRNQVTLLNEDGAILGSKYLNSAEDVRTGNSLEITNYLVDVGEDREAKVFPGDVQEISKIMLLHGKYGCTGENWKDASLGKVLGSYSSNSNINKRNSNGNSKLIRDAHQILSTLKRPIAPPSPVRTKKPLLEQICSSQSSESQFGLQEKLSGQNAQQPNLSKDIVVDDHKDSLETSEVGNISKMTISMSDISYSKAAEDLGTFDIKNLTDTNHGGKPKSSGSLGLAASDIPTSEPDAGCLEKCTKASTPSIPEFQVSEIVIFDHPEDAQTPTGLSVNNSGITNDATDENSNQLCADRDVDSRCGECLTMAVSIPIDLASSCPNDVESKSLDMNMNMPEEKMDMNEFPSFDLGF